MRADLRRAMPAALLVFLACGGGARGGAVPAPAALVYSVNPATYTVTVPIAPNAPSSGGGAPTSYAVAPALPPGLGLDPATGVLSGTPTAASPAATYTVTASNAGGSTSAALVLAVSASLPPAPLAYATSAAVYAAGVAIPPNAPSGGEAFTAFAISPPLPPGLSLDAATGVISGTPAALAPRATYTVTAAGPAGSTACALAVAVAAPGSVWLAPPPATLCTGAAQPLDAGVAGEPATPVRWSASAGTIDEAGLFSAPRVPGDVTLTATHPDDPSQSASATVTILARTNSYVKVELLDPPADVISGDRLTVVADVWSFFWLSAVEADLDGAPIVLAQDAAIWSGTADLSARPAGAAWLRVAATDFQGARTEAFRRLTLQR